MYLYYYVTVVLRVRNKDLFIIIAADYNIDVMATGDHAPNDIKFIPWAKTVILYGSLGRPLSYMSLTYAFMSFVYVISGLNFWHPLSCFYLQTLIMSCFEFYVLRRMLKYTLNANTAALFQ